MKILLTHGYFINENPVELRIMKPYPPLGLLFLSAWLKSFDIPNEVFDTTFADRNKLYSHLENSKPEIIGLYSTLMTKRNIRKIMTFIKDSHVLRNTKIIIGGPDARHNAEHYLNLGADVVVPGEGEETLKESIDVITSGDLRSLRVVKGISFLDNNRQVFDTGERKPLDLKHIPLPLYDSIDVPGYLQRWKSIHGYSSMTINSMRGCPFFCYWCSKSVFGNSYRRRDPMSVVDEMINLKNTYQPDQVWFTDDVFTISKEWLRQFSNEIQKRKLLLPYECITRSDCLDDEILEMLKKSGCRKVWIGAESGSQKVIDLMNRRIDLGRTTEMMQRLKSSGISTGTFIMLGYQGEGWKDIFKTAAFLKKSLPDDLTVGVAYPIKGTKYFEFVEPFFDKPYDWKSGNEKQIRFKRPFNERFYRFSSRYLFNLVAFKKANQGIEKWISFFKAMISKIYIFSFH